MTATTNRSIFSLPFQPLTTDGVSTATSREQLDTEAAIHRVLSTSSSSTPELRKNEHGQFIGALFFGLSAPYTALDASRPWLLFWSLHSFDIMGVALDQGNKDRAISTIMHFQHPDGGFGGGPGQLAHLLPTYASVMTLAIVGSPAAWAQIDRKKCYEFFMRCKQSDGSFVVCKGGEVDVRGIYCMLVVATVLDILTPELVRGTEAYVSACQTFEGGFAAASLPTFSSPSPFPFQQPTVSPASAEAHGGYTSCALFSLFLLKSASLTCAASNSPKAISKADPEECLRWAVQMQGESIEAGGFRGRANKLVDGCYGWWVGGLFAVLEAMIRPDKVEDVKHSVEDQNNEEWVDEPSAPSLYNRAALQEFILYAAQREASSGGGLRDKPGKRPDLYHTCNNLSGLSAAQHRVIHSASKIQELKSRFNTDKRLDRVGTAADSIEEDNERRREIWANARGWVEDESGFLNVAGPESRVNTTTPVFNILGLRVKPIIDYFYCQEGLDI